MATRKTPEKRADQKALFLQALADTHMVTEAAKAAGIARPTAYAWRTQDDDFADAWTEIEERSTEVLEQIAVRRAATGSDTLLIFLLKSRRPEKYADRLNEAQIAAIKQSARQDALTQLENEIARLPANARRVVMNALATANQRQLTP